jgi:hypothetical protein
MPQPDPLEGVLVAALSRTFPCGVTAMKDEPADTDPVAVTLMAATLQGFGNFLAKWSTYEIVVEILIMRELDITPEQASIVCTGRAVDVKLNMLQALMGERAKGHAGLSALLNARREAKRNLFVHGFFRVNRERGDLFLVSREIRAGYWGQVQASQL